MWLWFIYPPASLCLSLEVGFVNISHMPCVVALVAVTTTKIKRLTVCLNYVYLPLSSPQLSSRTLFVCSDGQRFKDTRNIFNKDSSPTQRVDHFPIRTIVDIAFCGTGILRYPTSSISTTVRAMEQLARGGYGQIL
jgi:hypothetical protein